VTETVERIEVDSAADAADPPLDQLVRRAKSGNRAAFSALIADHYDMIHRVAWKWCGDGHEAEDVAQEVCVKLATAISGFDGRAAFSSWVYRIVINTVRDRQRSAVRRKALAVAHLELAETEDAAGQEEALAAQELWQAVRQLPAKQRDAVLLIYAEEKTHAEAATILGIKEATVSWHVHEARKALRRLI